MDIGSIFLILTLLLLVGWYVVRPLFERKSPAAISEEQELSVLLAEKDRLLNTLQELDFDHTLGKIPEVDYPLQRAVLLQQGAAVLRQIDMRQPRTSLEAAEARLEAAIAARRATLTPAQPLSKSGEGGKGDDALESLIAARRRERQDRSGGFCPKCGRAVQKSDRFCPKCGNAL
jgi:hypothetical protein